MHRACGRHAIHRRAGVNRRQWLLVQRKALIDGLLVDVEQPEAVALLALAILLQGALLSGVGFCCVGLVRLEAGMRVQLGMLAYLVPICRLLRLFAFPCGGIALARGELGVRGKVLLPVVALHGLLGERAAQRDARVFHGEVVDAFPGLGLGVRQGVGLGAAVDEQVILVCALKQLVQDPLLRLLVVAHGGDLRRDDGVAFGCCAHVLGVRARVLLAACYAVPSGVEGVVAELVLIVLARWKPWSSTGLLLARRRALLIRLGCEHELVHG